MSLTKILLVPLIAIVAAFGIAACGDDDEDTTSAAATTEETTADSDATVAFVTPADGDAVSGDVTAEVEISGFEINADAVGMAPADGEGHLHFALDGGKYDSAKYSGANGELAEQLGVDGMYSPSTEPTITYTGLPAGEHTLTVYLVNNDHSETGVEETITFEVG